MSKSKELELGIAYLVESKAKHNWNPPLPGNGGGSLASKNILVGAITTSGKRLEVQSYPCHNPIRGFKDSASLFSAFGYRTSNETAKAYLHWLVTESPWTKLDIVPVLDEHFMFEYGFVWDNLDKTPANLLHSFLIASRAPAEWPKLIEDWYTLVTKHEIDPTWAFMFLTCLVNVTQVEGGGVTILGDKYEYTIPVQDKYDWPLDMARADYDYVRNFVSGKAPGINPLPFSPNATTSAINAIWGKPLATYSRDAYVNSVNEIYGETYGLKKGSDQVFYRAAGWGRDTGGKDIKQVKHFKADVIPEICRLEYERLFNSNEQKAAA